MPHVSDSGLLTPVAPHPDEYEWSLSWEARPYLHLSLLSLIMLLGVVIAMTYPGWNENEDISPM